MSHYECQVCDYKLGDEPNLKDQEGIENWCVQHIGLKNGMLEVLCCPKCSHLRMDEVFDGYKKKIRSGKDAEYH